MPKTESERLRIEQAAAVLQVSVGTLRRWRGIHYGPKAAKLGGLLFYYRDDLERWARAQLGYSGDRPRRSA
jgi:Helix-turn-helix domain